jgi:NADP-reducing hydrogenase subunit HndB
MAKMNLEQLRKLREDKRGDISRREVEGKEIQIIVGMGTCGIAAGAKQTFDEIVKAVDEQGIGAQIVIRQTGCMGLCYVEPTVEVVMPGMPTVIYGKMTSDVARDLVRKHLVERKLLDNHIFDRPAADIVKK